MTQVSIDAELARRLVARQFPPWANRLVTEVDRQGWDNRTFRLGGDLLVRLPSGESYALQVEKEHRWLPVLAPQLPLPVPAPVARGVPDLGYPYPWSVYRWLDGTPAADAEILDEVGFAVDVARFLRALQAVDATAGPGPGLHNWFRGGPLSIWADDTERALVTLGDSAPTDRYRAIWADALATTWTADPVWVHGDVAVGNLLVRDGRLAAVIDLGCAAVGDPACDTVLAWTRFAGPSREAFRETLALDDATWARGRGWALWKALISSNDGAFGAASRHVLNELLAEAG